MDNPDPLAHLKYLEDSSSDEEDDDAWDLNSNGVTRSFVFGT